MVKYRFRATPGRRTFLFEKPAIVSGTHGGKPTTKVVGPKVLTDGDVVEMDDFLAAWCEAHMAENFTKVPERKKTPGGTD